MRTRALNAAGSDRLEGSAEPGRGEPHREAPTRSLALAIVMDGSLAAAKLVAHLLTGSAAMLSEGLHSLADVANQGLLAVGIRASRRPPDPAHPYGHGRARPFWALLSASGVLFIGAGATLWNGVGRLVRPAPLEDLELGLGVLALGFVSELVSFVVATRSLARRARASGVSLREAVKRSGDPVLVAIVAEDAAGLAGVVAAASGIGLSHLLGDPIYDALGAIVVGLVMTAAALFLIDRNRQLLVGVSIAAARKQALQALLTRSPMVRGARDVKATALDEHTVRLKAEVDFDGTAVADEWLAEHDPASIRALADDEAVRGFLREFADHVVRRVGREVDAIEADIQASDPAVRHIDLEVDVVPGRGGANPAERPPQDRDTRGGRS